MILRSLTIAEFRRKIKKSGHKIKDELELIDIIFSNMNLGISHASHEEFVARFQTQDHLHIMQTTSRLDPDIAGVSQNKEVQEKLIARFMKADKRGNPPDLRRLMANIIRNAVDPNIQKQILEMQMLFGNKGLFGGYGYYAPMNRTKLIEAFIRNNAPVEILLLAARSLTHARPLQLALSKSLELDPKMTRAYVAKIPDDEYYRFSPNILKVYNHLRLGRERTRAPLIAKSEIDVIRFAHGVATL